MKVLRIFDHLGELKKEFNLYVEGEDFKWQSSYPEPIWLGTITLEDAGKEPEEPSESVSELSQPEPVVTTDMPHAAAEQYFTEPEPEPEVTEEAEKVLGAVEEIYEDPDAEAKFEEVKHEFKKHDRKRSRVKRSTPSASSKSTEGLHQDDPGGDTPKGD